jgi:hypothetical protein
VGSGGNFAAWRQRLLAIEGWHEGLGAGSPGQAGEDAELFHRLLRRGGRIRYAGEAIVRHAWGDEARRQATRSSYGFGVGAVCGIAARSGDRFAGRMLADYGSTHVRHLAHAARARDLGRLEEHLRALGSVPGGLAYGWRTGPWKSELRTT